ncbi:MAG: protein-L-isoaspartate(D-aspartate) O-methyltransferase [bacterium]
MSEQRKIMVRDTIASRGVRDPAVLAAMRRVPRHEFVPERFRSAAYADEPLPIGMDQTISQPYIVAAMTELIQVGPQDTVLEIGTGSGYQAAVLAEVVKRVYSIEILPELGRTAAELLARLGYTNVDVRIGDGYVGWPEHAPFDGIIVTAGADHVPVPLVEQLKAGGRMVIPVGPTLSVQDLLLIEKMSDGSIRTNNIMPVRFVPLTRAGARSAK